MKEERKKWRRGSRKEKEGGSDYYSIGLLSVNFVLNTELYLRLIASISVTMTTLTYFINEKNNKYEDSRIGQH